MDLREIKARARTDLHNAMKVRAFYFVSGTPALAPVPIYVRVHTKMNKQLGDLKGTNLSYAETEAHVPALLFWRSEVPSPEHNAVVAISADEMYKVDTAQPPDGLTITASVNPMTGKQRAVFAAWLP